MSDRKNKAIEAVRELLLWSGEDPQREGLRQTPNRVVEAYQEFFSGYATDPKDLLADSFEEVGGYADIVLLRDVEFYSHCEHHMVPFWGTADLAYLPDRRVVGFSRLIRVLQGYSRRLQVQERLTQQVAEAIFEVLRPKAVGVFLRAEHMCMSMRGVRRSGIPVETHTLLGEFSEEGPVQRRLFSLLQRS